MVNFQCKITKVMEAVRLSFDNLDLVVNSFEFASVDCVVAVVQNAISVPVQHVGKTGDRRVF